MWNQITQTDVLSILWYIQYLKTDQLYIFNYGTTATVWPFQIIIYKKKALSWNVMMFIAILPIVHTDMPMCVQMCHWKIITSTQ